MNFSIKNLKLELISKVVCALNKDNIPRSQKYFERCIDEQTKCIRSTLVAFIDDQPVGVVHLLKNSFYPNFIQNNIPEINDLLVVKDMQRQGIGEKLVSACEDIARREGYISIGLGVGLYKDYGMAQRLYFRLGYKPDGNGLMYCNQPVAPGTNVFVDDDLLIYLVKNLG